MVEHIHWKKTTNPDYLGTYAFDRDQEMIVRIKDLRQEKIQNPNGGSEEKIVMYFDGDIKPMILNTTNMKNIEKALKTPYMDEWVGRKLQLYVDPAVSAFGQIVAAVRVRDFEPK